MTVNGVSLLLLLGYVLVVVGAVTLAMAIIEFLWTTYRRHWGKEDRSVHDVLTSTRLASFGFGLVCLAVGIVLLNGQ